MITSEPILEIPFLNAGRGPGGYYVDRLPVHSLFADALPHGLDAIVATADLQGRELFEESPTDAPRLLGEALPRRLAEELLPGLDCDPLKTGAILAGDFYTVPGLDHRGGSGDVTRVWDAFGREFRWVVGVAGNHDTFGESLHPRRSTDDSYIDALIDLLDPSVDIMITHDGPEGPQRGQRGSPRVTHVLNELSPPLVIRGHAHWETPLVKLDGGTVVLNVDCRLLVIRRRS